MKPVILSLALITALSCTDARSRVLSNSETDIQSTRQKQFPKDTWQDFLQHLPLKDPLVLDYRGNPIPNQSKAYANVDYDIGNRDLQQCADALIRLRSEYLFAQQKYNEIRFHFTNGDLYTWDEYCAGRRPIARGTGLIYSTTAPCDRTHPNLRKYLDIVYAYAGTISLYKELNTTDDFEIGAVIITPGSPGHCCIIIDETIIEGKRFYKLAEGYTPAQSIYVLRNAENDSPWFELTKGVITTSTYQFTNYKLGTFESAE